MRIVGLPQENIRRCFQGCRCNNTLKGRNPSLFQVYRSGTQTDYWQVSGPGLTLGPVGNQRSAIDDEIMTGDKGPRRRREEDSGACDFGLVHVLREQRAQAGNAARERS